MMPAVLSAMTGGCGAAGDLGSEDEVGGIDVMHSLPRDQYLGRCELTHSRACGMGSRGTAARSLSVAGKASIRSRQRQNAGNFGYTTLPSCVRLKANVLGSR